VGWASGITLDPTFGQDGKVITPFPGTQSVASAVVIQPDGRIVAAGTGGSPTARRVAMARYDSFGHLDGSFGSGGLVITDAGGGTESWATGIALQSDGKIVVCGVVIVVAPSDTAFLVIRYLPDGTLDPSFGAGGIVITNVLPGGLDQAASLAVGSDGRVVVGGSATYSTGVSAFALARYDSAGNPDSTFGTGGKLLVPLSAGESDGLSALSVDLNGTITGCGGSIVAGFPFDRFAVIRLLADGSFDPTFGTGGRAYAQAGTADSGCTAMSIQSDGKIVAFGVATTTTPATSKFALVRFLGGGSLDSGFGSGGVVVTQFDGNSNATSGGVAVDGRIVEVGSAFVGSQLDFALAGFLPNGQPDTTFAPMGHLTTDFGAHDGASAMAIQADGRIIAAGFSGPGRGEQFALARYGEVTAAVPALSVWGMLVLAIALALLGALAIQRPA
jgi:uncharacterized delta-60 repeat protein